MANTAHDAVFNWLHPGAQSVVVTGTFDNWSGSKSLERASDGFHGSVKLPWGQKTFYKYIVDGKWLVDDTKPQEADHDGNINNVYQSPLEPTPAPPLTDIPSHQPSTSTIMEKAQESISNVVEQVKQSVPAQAAAIITDSTSPLTQQGAKPITDSTPSPSNNGPAAPIVHAAEAMPPTTAQALLDQSKVALSSVMSSSTTAAPKSTQVDLHPSETPAAPLLDAAASMPPTTAQATLDQTVTKATQLHETHVAPAIASAKESLTTENLAAVANTAQENVIAAAAAVQESVVAPATAAASSAMASAMEAIPDEHKAKINETVVKPVVDAVQSETEEGALQSSVAPALAYIASGLGAAIKTVTGVDPINADKIPVQTPLLESPPPSEPTISTMPTKSANEEQPLVPAEPVVTSSTIAAAPEPVPKPTSEALPAVVPTSKEASTHTPLMTDGTPGPMEKLPTEKPAVETSMPPSNGESKLKEESMTPVSPPETPRKAFPSVESANSSPSNSPSKLTDSVRKKRVSIFGKIKNVFHHDKEKEKMK